MDLTTIIGYSVIGLIIFCFVFFIGLTFSKRNDPDPTEVFLNSMVQLLNGQIEFSNPTLTTNKIATIKFNYDSMPFQFVYHYPGGRGTTRPYLAVSTTTNFSLKVFYNLGNSIGPLVENAYALSLPSECRDVDNKILPEIFKYTRVLSNDEGKAIRFLMDNEVLEIANTYGKVQSFWSTFYIKNGDLMLTPDWDELNRNNASIKNYLSSMIVLVRKIS